MIKKSTAISVLFVVAALYDGLLGLAFLCGADAVFKWAQVTPPNHLGYVQFPAALLIVFAIMFLAIARKPRENRRLISYGMMLKVSYAGVVVYHWSASGIPNLWKPFAVFDMVFFALFALAYLSLDKHKTT